jgi:hypothetical protein
LRNIIKKSYKHYQHHYYYYYLIIKFKYKLKNNNIDLLTTLALGSFSGVLGVVENEIGVIRVIGAISVIGVIRNNL